MSNDINKGKRTVSSVRYGRGSSSVRTGKRVVAKITGHKMAERVKQQKYRMMRSMTPQELHDEWVKSNIEKSIVKAVDSPPMGNDLAEAAKNYAAYLKKPSSKPSQSVKDVLPQRPEADPKRPVKGQDVKDLASKLKVKGKDPKLPVKNQVLGNLPKKTVLPKSFVEEHPDMIKKALAAALPYIGRIVSAVGTVSNIASAAGGGNGSKEPVSTEDEANKSMNPNGGDVETIVRANVERIRMNPFSLDKAGGKEKIKTVMREFSEGKLHSGSGDKVTDKKQALAIAYSEAGLSRKK